jgi:hypothetical protein
MEPKSDAESVLAALVKRYRAQHKDCRVLLWTAPKGFNDISVDNRCALCRKTDELYGEPVDAAELRKS